MRLLEERKDFSLYYDFVSIGYPDLIESRLRYLIDIPKTKNYLEVELRSGDTIITDSIKIKSYPVEINYGDGAPTYNVKITTYLEKKLRALTKKVIKQWKNQKEK